MKRIVMVSVLSVAGALTATVALAQPMGVPPGAWWSRPRLAQALDLTVEQKASLEKVSFEHARRMVDLQAAVKKAELDLRAAADATPFDAAAVRTAFHAFQQARVKLDSERFELLLAQRGLLSTEQWRKLRQIVRERVRERPGDERSPEENEPPRRWQRR